MSDGSSGEPAKQGGGDLSDLRSRLAALHGSVERLGREGGEPAPGPATPPPGQAPVPPPAPAEQGPSLYDHAVEPAQPGYEQPPAPAYDPYAAPPAYDPATPPYGYSEPAPADPYAPAPAATNGQAQHELPPAAANVTILDVGPFADLIELRHFEEAVARLEAVRDVRVRRFGHRRAMIELGLGGPYAIGRELFQLGRPMQIEPGPEGEVIVDFTDVPDVAEEPQPEASQQPAESEQGDESAEPESEKNV
jgi:hypothetical protein